MTEQISCIIIVFDILVLRNCFSMKRPSKDNNKFTPRSCPYKCGKEFDEFSNNNNYQKHLNACKNKPGQVH